MSDSGAADPRLDAALAAYDGTAGTRAKVLAALAGARVFVAITATSTAVHTAEATGLRAESSAEMALVSVVASDGGRAVPAFADTAALRRWRLDLRPVPVAAEYLARAALDDGADAVLLDPGRAAVVLRADDLASLAAGYVPVPGALLAARRTVAGLTAPPSPPDEQLVAALAAAVRPERLRAARLLEGPGGPVLGIAPRHPLDPAALTDLAQRVRARLGPAVPPGGLDLAVVPPRGPGHRVIRRRWPSALW
ncbi:MAG: SseB family protein [Frankiaceae bacterium]|nr:SseB family protein [Frankiaceae bacterium]